MLCHARILRSGLFSVLAFGFVNLEASALEPSEDCSLNNDTLDFSSQFIGPERNQDGGTCYLHAGLHNVEAAISRHLDQVSGGKAPKEALDTNVALVRYLRFMQQKNGVCPSPKAIDGGYSHATALALLEAPLYGKGQGVISQKDLENSLAAIHGKWTPAGLVRLPRSESSVYLKALEKKANDAMAAIRKWEKTDAVKNVKKGVATEFIARKEAEQKERMKALDLDLRNFRLDWVETWDDKNGRMNEYVRGHLLHGPLTLEKERAIIDEMKKLCPGVYDDPREIYEKAEVCSLKNTLAEGAADLDAEEVAELKGYIAKLEDFIRTNSNKDRSGVHADIDQLLRENPSFRSKQTDARKALKHTEWTLQRVKAPSTKLPEDPADYKAWISEGCGPKSHPRVYDFVMKHVCQKRPVAFTTKIKGMKFGTGTTGHPDSRDSNHLMVIQGFFTKDGKKIFKLRNSWGPGSWAELPFDELCRLVGTAQAILTPLEIQQEEDRKAGRAVRPAPASIPSSDNVPVNGDH